MKTLTKIIAFFLKEFHDVRRQPRLLLSLVGGPLLVLAAFGATFRSANPFIAAVLVWPENGVPGVDRQQAEDFIGENLYLAHVTSDRAEAMAMLDRGEVDVVQIVPDVTALQEEGLEAASRKRPQIEVYSRTIDPTAEAWIRSLAFGELSFINQQLLAQEANLAQAKAQEVAAYLADAQGQFEEIQRNYGGRDIERVSSAVEDLQKVLLILLEILPPIPDAQANLAPELFKVHQDVQLLADDLNELQHVLRNGSIMAQFERIRSAVDEIGSLRGTIDLFVSVPADNIISPVQETYSNLRGAPYSMVIFYTPAVLALLIQQLAITLGSLGLVREQQMGSFEMFRVSPLRFSHILVGKAVAYIIYVTVAGLILTGLLAVLKVPMPAAHPLQHVALLLLLATASVGIGFLISTLSRSDSQAIQLTMLSLLLSIFFTGFFLPVSGFSWPAWIIAVLLPMTHAIEGFQSLLLKGTGVSSGVWWALLIIIVLSYGLVWLIMRRGYRRTA